jgi:hypothetical protein
MTLPTNLMSVDQALEALPVRKSRRWLVEFLHSTKTDPHGRPLYRMLGRDKLVYLDRLIEAMPCPSKLLPAGTRKRKTSTSGAPTSKSELTRLAELTGVPLQGESATTSSEPSSGENIRPGKLRLIHSSQRS